ncbi:titin-like isoform X3 [Venturia canescens]|uniref:titin-like isoform X3 n=1 Tax=Venturia canescens TaxID=32260 RepID=UPI001C9CA8ED|nr:titin-like isoform X3 [Venturia canescens]
MSVINLKFTKFDNTPWGFRLAGGSDFPQPLTVIKVAEGSLAECMGLRLGDIVMSLNDRPVSSLTHGQAHEALVLAGNNFSLSVLRPIDCSESVEVIQQENIVPYTIPLDQLPPVFPEEILTAPVEEYSFVEETREETVEVVQEEIPPKPVDANSEVVPNKNLTDEEIAQLILEEEELLIPDQGVLGVNFKKIRPRVEKLKQSKVLEELQKIAVEDPPRVQELKHTSTFLQKPERPPPPSKNDLDKQTRAEGEQYRVVIKKQQKKSVTERLLERGLLEPREDTGTPEPPSEIKTPTLTPEPGRLSREEVPSEAERKPEPEEEDRESVCEETEEPKVPEISVEESKDEEESTPETMSCPRNANLPQVPTFDKEKVKELVSTEISLEKQLEAVQNQLLALKQLPSEIENHLRIVSEQLHKIMELSGVQNGEEESNGRAEAEERSTCKSPVSPVENEHEDKDEHLQASEPEIRESPSTMMSDEPPIIIEPEADEDEPAETKELGEVNVKSTVEEEGHVKKCIATYQTKVLKSREPSPAPSYGSYEPDPNLSPQDQVIQELKHRGGRRRSNDLWPQAKQLELTYGRRWRCPNDFFNDEMIAEVLSSQAEVIRGRAMGVNFKKFEKNWLPNYDHLMGSSVYKMLHKMEREPKTGIPARPPKVIAAEDIIERVRSPALSIADDRSARGISH